MSDRLGSGSDELTRPKGKSAAAFRTISEVATALELPQHVLRFWETRFPQIKPLKRGGGRRYYRPEDVTLLQDIRRLLYNEGYTIKGVQRLLRDGTRKSTPASDKDASPRPTPAHPPAPQKPVELSEAARSAIHSAIAELEEIRADLLDRASERG